jgi:transposase InsO family protein
MSRKGNCWDNSPTERFFRSLKSEQLNYEKFRTKVSAMHISDLLVRMAPLLGSFIAKLFNILMKNERHLVSDNPDFDAGALDYKHLT